MFAGAQMVQQEIPETGPLYVVVKGAGLDIVDGDAPWGAFRLSTSNSDLPVQIMIPNPAQVMVSNPRPETKVIDQTSTKASLKPASEEDDYESEDASTTMQGSGLPSGAGFASTREFLSESSEPTTSTKVDDTLADCMDHFGAIELPSVGSAEHFQDACVPCTLFSKNTCRFERGCSYCHFEHVIKARPNKRARGRAKAYSARVRASGEEPTDEA